jgi:transposase
MPLVDTIRSHVFAADRIHIDDTTVPVLVRGKSSDCRLWTYLRRVGPFARSAAAVFLFYPLVAVRIRNSN